MSKTPFKRLLRSPEKKPAAALAIPPVVYSDKDVCRVLRVRRRVLVEARTAASRGVDWDAANAEVGMTRAWVDRYALDHHVVPDFTAPLLPTEGRYVSVRLIGTTPNLCLVQVELEATGEREFCRTRNQKVYPMHFMEAFSAVRLSDGQLEWIHEPNAMKY